MKRVSYILGLISCLIIFFGSMFKIQHWPGASIMLVLGILSFVLIFLPVSLTHHYYSSSGKKNAALHIVTFITGLVVFTAALFKILHWPAAGVIMVFSIPFPFLIFLPVFIYSSNRNKAPIREYSYILMLLLFYALTSSLLALNISRNILDEGVLSAREWTNIEKEAILSNPSFSIETNDAQDHNNIEIEQLKTTGDKLCREINQLIFDVATGVNKSNADAIDKNGNIDFLKLNGLDALISNDQLFHSAGKGSEFKDHMHNYQTMLLSFDKIKNSPAGQLIQKLLDTSPAGENSWEDTYFVKQHMIWEINSLQEIRACVRICESESLNILLSSK